MGFLSSLFGFGSSKAQPATQTVVQSQKLPPEIAPFVKEIAGEAQDLFKQRAAEGYVPFTGETIAQFTPQEETAMAGIEGLVGTARPLQEEALGITRGLGEKFTPEKAQEYMSPYQKAVTDIEQREAQTRFEREIRPRFEASAVQAGGMSGLGTRAGVEAAELQRGQSQLLADIETRGLQSAFQDAQNQFAQQKTREAGMATEIGRAGPAMLASGLQEAGALQSVGAEKRERDQSTLDDAYFKFLEGQRHPEQTLAEYSGFIYGNPLTQMGTTSKTGTSTPYQPSLGQSLLSLGSTLGSAYLRGRAGGGYIDRDRGLSGLPMFRRQENGQVVDEDDRPELIQLLQKGIDAIMPDFSESNALAKELRRLNPNYMYADDEAREALVKQARENLGFDPEYGAVDRVSLEEGRANAAKYKERVDAQKNKRAKELLQQFADQKDVAKLKRQGLGELVTLAPASQSKATREKTSAAIKKVDDTLKREKEERESVSELDAVEVVDDPAVDNIAEFDVIQNVETTTPAQKKNAKKIQKALANQPSEGKLISMTVEEAAAKYDANPAAFGDMTREQLLKDTADYNKRYMDTIKRIYPEAQNEILADALQALGAMFVAENKGEAFTKTFNDLQKAGMKRRDARRIALGKAGLENLKSDKATLDKIRQLPKQRRDAINEMIKRREEQIDRVETRKYRERMGIKAEEIGKFYKRKPATTPKTAASPRSVSTADATLGHSLLKTPSFFQGALGKYNIPETVLLKTGVTNPEQVRKLIELTLEKESVRNRIMSQAKTIQAQKSGKGGTTVGFEQALEAATSLVLQNIYDSGRITFDDGIIYDSVEGLDD